MRTRWRQGALSDLPVTVVGNDERDAAVATLVAAFAGDPVERWLYPGSTRIARTFRPLSAAFGAGASAGAYGSSATFRRSLSG